VSVRQKASPAQKRLLIVNDLRNLAERPNLAETRQSRKQKADAE